MIHNSFHNQGIALAELSRSRYNDGKQEEECDGKPRSAIRLSETVKTGEGQQRDTHPDDN